MTLQRILKWIPTLLISLFLLISSGYSQEEDIDQGELLEFSLEELMNVKVKAATKTETPISQSPGAVTVITYAQIRESAARTLPELLRLVAGVNVRWNPMMQTIDMRGFGATPFTSRVLLLIDDIPYNSWNKGGFPQQPGFDFFVLQNIKQIEVIRGPSSALYGENAYWGVINIITLSGEDLEGGSVEVYGGDRETRSASAIYGRQFKDGSILVSGKYLQSQFPTEFWFEENNSRVKGSDIFIKGQYKDLELSYYRHDDRADGFDEPFANPNFPPGSAFKSAEKLEQSVDIAALKYERTSNDQKFRFAGDLSYARRSGSRCTACHAVEQQPGFGEKVNHGYQLIGNLMAELNYLPRQKILVGVEGRKVDSKDSGDQLLQTDPATGSATVLNYSKYAFFIQDQISLAENRLQIVAGARFDTQTSPDLFGNRFSPRIAAVYNPNNRVTFRGGWNKAFHFPDFSSLYQNTWFLNVQAGETVIPLAVFAPNSNLKPEAIQGFDFGVEYRFSQKHSGLSARLDAYRSTVEDFIVLVYNSPPPPDNTTVRFENHPDKASIWGGELELRYDFKQKISGFINYAYQNQSQANNLVDGSGKPFEFVYAPQNKINFGGYFGPFAGLRGTLEMTWRDTYQFPSFWNLVTSGFTDPNIGEHESYTYLNLRLTYEIPFLAGRHNRWLRFNFYARNLFDDKPNETVIGVNNTLPGREFFGGIEFRLGLK